MNPKSPREQEDEDLLRERAAEWVQVLKTAGDAERAEFADWLSESPRHAREYLLTTALDRELDRLALENPARMQELLGRPDAVVVPLKATKRSRATLARRAGRRYWAAGLAASIIALLFVLGVAQHRLTAVHTYSTAIGEERTIVLPDGSQLTLTARTETRVRFSKEQRQIDLVAGEAMFRVAQDPVRPFKVHSGESVIEALGTQFNVLRRPSGTTVSVLEGAVKVNGSSSVLRAGDEIRVAASGRIEKRLQSAQVGTAQWRQRRLVFRADTLTDIAAEFNRYNRQPRLVVDASAAQSPRYTGVFDADDPRSLLAFLREDRQIVLEERGQELLIRAR